MTRIQEILRGTSLAQSKGLAIFTICSNNYVSMASILLVSAERSIPMRLFICA